MLLISCKVLTVSNLVILNYTLMSNYRILNVLDSIIPFQLNKDFMISKKTSLIEESKQVVHLVKIFKNGINNNTKN